MIIKICSTLHSIDPSRVALSHVPGSSDTFYMEECTFHWGYADDAWSKESSLKRGSEHVRGTQACGILILIQFMSFRC